MLAYTPYECAYNMSLSRRVIKEEHGVTKSDWMSQRDPEGARCWGPGIRVLQTLDQARALACARKREFRINVNIAVTLSICHRVFMPVNPDILGW